MITAKELASKRSPSNFETNIKKIEQDFENMDLDFLEQKRCPICVYEKYDYDMEGVEYYYHDTNIMKEDIEREKYKNFFQRHGYICSYEVDEERKEVWYMVGWL